MANETKTLALPKFEVKDLQVDFQVDKYIKELEEHTADFALVITDDNIANGKKAAAELNKIGKEISTLIKERLTPTKAKITEVKDGEKKLLAVIADRREQINIQIEALEKKHLDKARELLTAWLEECRADYRIRDEFISDFNVESEVKLGSLNSKRDSLAKSARDKVESAVAKERNLQQQTDLRLSQLTNLSNEAGLDAPLERRHIETFLFADEDTYQANLKAYMDAELDRQNIAAQRRKKEEADRIAAAEQRARDEATREANQKAAQERAKEEAERLAEQQKQNEQQAVQQRDSFANDEQKKRAAALSERKPVGNSDGTRTVTVTVTFRVTVPGHVTDGAVSQRVGQRLSESGFEWESCHA